MKRRNFLQNSIGLGAALSSSHAWADPAQHTTNNAVFKLNFAPHDGMFSNHAGTDVLRQIQFMADEGFSAFEDNGMASRPVEQQKQIGKLLEKLEMKMGVFVAHKIYWNEGNLASGNPDRRKEFLKDISNAVEVAKRVNAKWMTVVPGCVHTQISPGFQFANVVESLKQASEILAQNNLIMVLEPLNFRDHPNMFLYSAPQAYSICKAVNSPACKILFDIYHIQIQEGNIIPNIDACWDEIDYFQIGDNPGRKEPTTGELNYLNIFKHIHTKGFNGILGMEHGNALPNQAGERALINAYKAVNQF
ncbi:MAG: hydroxypyruvate isomerase family protein [Chitinophagales bacterium]|jgi:hydroxypyruvate isomerase